MVNWTAPNATDNVDGMVSPYNMSVTPAGAIMGEMIFFTGHPVVITYYYEDMAGNQANCTFSVTLQDHTPASISGCPNSITVGNQPEMYGAVVTWASNLTVTDNSMIVFSVANISQPYINLHNGSMFPLGVTTMTYVFSDPSQIPAICSFNVTVADANGCMAAPNGNCNINAICIDSPPPAPGTADANGRTCICTPGYWGDGTECVQQAPVYSVRLNLTLGLNYSDIENPYVLGAQIAAILINETGATSDQIGVFSVEPKADGTTLVVIDIRSSSTSGPTPAAIAATITNLVQETNSPLAAYEPQSATSTAIADQQTSSSSGLSPRQKMGITLGVIAGGGLALVTIAYLVKRSKEKGGDSIGSS